MKYLILLTALLASTIHAQELIVGAKQATPVAAQPQANVGITPDGDIVIVPTKTIKNGVVIPIVVSPEDANKQRAEMAKRKAERIAKARESKSASGSSSSSVKTQ